MNYFTKEELQSIIGAFRYIDDDPGWRGTIGWDDDLRTKIHSMIDNYCDHDKDVWPLYSLKGDLAVAGVCYDCGNTVDVRFVGDN